ncbi:MAG: hypothetical protein NXI14_05985 [bacterium]|nr:hypothetical protein [bacterium]
MPELDIHLRGASFLTLWEPADPALVAAAVPPTRLLWLVVLRVPHAHQKHAGWESMPITGVALGDDGRTGRPLTVREVSTNRNGPVVLRADLPADAFLRIVRLNDDDPEQIALAMLRDWLDGALFSDRLDFHRLAN